MVHLLSILPFRKKLNDVKPSANDLRAEISRRFAINSSDLSNAPRPKTGTISRDREWLNEHPITGEDDIQFIQKTIAECIQAAEMAAEGKIQVQCEMASAGAMWTWKYPMLRLIHVLIDQLIMMRYEIKSAFIRVAICLVDERLLKTRTRRKISHHLFGSCSLTSGMILSSCPLLQRCQTSIPTSPDQYLWFLSQCATCKMAVHEPAIEPCSQLLGTQWPG